MTQITRYSLRQLLELNSDAYREVDPDLEYFLSSIPKNKFLSTKYLNPYNPYLNQLPVRKQLFPKAEAFTDEKIIADIKAILGKLTENNKDEILVKLSKLHYTQSCWDQVAALFHQVTIDCVFLVETYIDIIIEFCRQYPNLIKKFNGCVLGQLKSPKQFDDSQDHLSCESAVDKTKRWQIDNMKIITELYRRKKYQSRFMVEHILTPLLNQITPEQTLGIEIMMAVLPIIGPQLPVSECRTIMDKLTTVSKDQKYPSRLRFLLMDLIELYQQKWITMK